MTSLVLVHSLFLFTAFGFCGSIFLLRLTVVAGLLRHGRHNRGDAPPNDFQGDHGGDDFQVKNVLL